jgi:hypothetical protein
MGHFHTPNFFLALLRAGAWLFWRKPVAKSEPPTPKRPRRPVFCYNVGDIPYDLFAIIRISWYRKGMAYEIEEYQIDECDDALAQFQYVVGTALKQNADVSVLTQYEPDALGVHQ